MNEERTGAAAADHAPHVDRSNAGVGARPGDGIGRTVVRHDDAGAHRQAVAHEHHSDLWLNGDGSDAEVRIAGARIDGYLASGTEYDGAERQESPKIHDPLPSEVRQPDWRGTRVACGSPWLCVAGFRRLCLFRAPSEEGCALPNSVCRLLLREQNGRQQLDDFSSRWRPGGLSDSRRRSPVALRHRLSTALL